MESWEEDPLAALLGPVDSEEEYSHPAAAVLLAESSRVAEKVVAKLTAFRSIYLAELSRTVERMRKTIPEQSGNVGFVAVDSTFPPEGGIELVGGIVVGIIAGYVSFVGGLRPPRQIYAKALFVEDEDARQKVPLAAKILEKRVAEKVLELLEECGCIEEAVIVLDGEIVPYKLLYAVRKSIRRSRMFQALDKATRSFLEKARRQKVTVIGVVKRSYSKLFSALAGRQLPLNDKAIASILLRNGEYMVIGRYAEIIPRYNTIAGKSAPGEPVGSPYGDIVVGFYKPKKGVQAVKIEVLDYGGVGLDEIISALDSVTNPATGLPYPVDAVDEYVRLESRLMELLRRKVQASIIDSIGPQAAIVLAHTNPEKRYIYEPRKR